MDDNFQIPVIHLEKTISGESIDRKGRGIPDLSGAVYFAQAFASNIIQECFLLFAVEDSGLKPIHIQIVTEPQDFAPYRLGTREMYRTAVASNASTLVMLHNSPMRIADVKKDISVYEEVKAVGDKIGIPLVDYVVLTGGMLYGIYEAPFLSAFHWNGLKIIGCTVCKRPLYVNSEDFCIVSAYQPERGMLSMDGKWKLRGKPFTTGIQKVSERQGC